MSKSSASPISEPVNFEAKPLSMDIELKRLLHRLQASLATTAHASSSEDEVNRRWTYVDYANQLLQNMREELTHEEDVKRLMNYENKLTFVTQLM